MQDAIENFERICSHFPDHMLLLVGIAGIGLGLWLWLGGLRFSKAVTALLGAITGSAYVHFVLKEQILFIAIGALIAAAVSILFEKGILTIIGAVALCVIVMIFFTGPILNSETYWDYPQHQIANDQQVIPFSEAVSILKTQGLFFYDTFHQAVRKVSGPGFAIAIAAGVALLAGGFALPRLTAAFTCSLFGTILIAAGMELVLLFKGALPIAELFQRPVFYGLITISMLAFGTLMQIILCPRRKKKKLKIPKENDQEK